MVAGSTHNCTMYSNHAVIQRHWDLIQWTGMVDWTSGMDWWIGLSLVLPAFRTASDKSWAAGGLGKKLDWTNELNINMVWLVRGNL